MASRTFTKIPRLIIPNLRNSSDDKALKKEEPSSFWDFFRKKPAAPSPPPPKESCRRRWKAGAPRCEPDLSQFGGEPYRTCGSAYVVQVDVIPENELQHCDEDAILKKIEAEASVKENVGDPMPPFRSVEQRLIDLNERKLHPFYRRYLERPRRLEEDAPQARAFAAYRCKSGPVSAAEIPDNFKVDKGLIEKKNIFADFKQVELPKQLLVRMVEMEKNKRPTLERKEEKKEESK